MMTPHWTRFSGGYELPGFRVFALTGRGRYRWRLEAEIELPDGSSVWQVASYHRRLKTAQMRAASIVKERLRHRRITWRVVLGTLLLFVSIYAMAFAVNLGVFLGGAAAFGLAVRFWLEATAIRVGDDTLAQSWPRLERVALWAMEALRPRRATTTHRSVSPLLGAPPALDDGDEDEDELHVHASPMHVC